MNKKYIFNNIFLIIYPFILLVSVLCNSFFHEKITKNNLNIFQLICLIIIYFLIFSLFIFIFFIKKDNFHIIPLIIGLIEIIALLVPHFLLKISNNLFSVIYEQLQLSIFMFGTLLTLYTIILIMFFNRIRK